MRTFHSSYPISPPVAAVELDSANKQSDTAPAMMPGARVRILSGWGVGEYATVLTIGQTVSVQSDLGSYFKFANGDSLFDHLEVITTEEPHKRLVNCPECKGEAYIYDRELDLSGLCPECGGRGSVVVVS